MDAALEQARVRAADVETVCCVVPSTRSGSRSLVSLAQLAGRQLRLRGVLRGRGVLGRMERTSAEVAASRWAVLRQLPWPLETTLADELLGDPRAAGLRAVWGALLPNDIGAPPRWDLGPAHPDIESHRKLGVLGLPRRRPDDFTGAVAQLLLAGRAVAWFQGGAELTPWPLGHRTLLRLRAREAPVPIDEVGFDAAANPDASAAQAWSAWGCRARGLPRRVSLPVGHPLAEVCARLPPDALLCGRALQTDLGGPGLPVITPLEAGRAFRDEGLGDALAIGPYLVERDRTGSSA